MGLPKFNGCEILIERIVISIILAFFIAQTIKLIKEYTRAGEWNLAVYLQNGGMPSAHTSTAVALSIGLLLETGLSYFFIIAALFTIIIMNDAMKVRRETGEEARVLNVMMRKENIGQHKLAESVGHTPTEVIVGFILGVVATLIVYAF